MTTENTDTPLKADCPSAPCSASELALSIDVITREEVDGSIHAIIIDALMTQEEFRDYSTAHQRADEICEEFANSVFSRIASYGTR